MTKRLGRIRVVRYVNGLVLWYSWVEVLNDRLSLRCLGIPLR